MVVTDSQAGEDTLHRTMADIHPVQAGKRIKGMPTNVTLAAYEVYSHVYGPQEALVTGGCRGGFCPTELIAFLYARAFPKTEWRMRVDEALEGVQHG